MSGESRRFPWILTISATVASAVLVGLGVWQVERLGETNALLAEIAALAAAPPRPLATVVDGPERKDFRRVEARCLPAPARPGVLYRYAVRDGRIAWRLLGVCRLGAGPYDGIVVDRGLVERFTGATSPKAAPFPAAADVIGILRAAGSKPLLGPALMEAGSGFTAYRVLDHASLSEIAAGAGLRRPAPYVLAVERETPSTAGVTPAALPPDVPHNNLVYAVTWFALAGILAWFYGAMLLRRLRP